MGHNPVLNSWWDVPLFDCQSVLVNRHSFVCKYLCSHLFILTFFIAWLKYIMSESLSIKKLMYYTKLKVMKPTILYWFFRPLHTAIINGNTEVVNNLLDVMQTMPNLWLKINAYNNLLQVKSNLQHLFHSQHSKY